ncbi:MAG TPA: hypothetical protein VGH11_17455 [Jatrophihabitans sp.]
MTAQAPDPGPVFDHLDHLTDDRGVFEHALHASPRPEHGYCVDDVARALVVVCREPHPDRTVRRLARCYLDFVLAAVDSSGRCNNRMGVDGQWQDAAALGDWWGRALWGLGVAAAGAESAGMRARALTGFRIAAQQRSMDTRAMAFAALGAAELLRVRPDEHAARDLLVDGVHAIGPRRSDEDWPWPEARLSYANGALAEALILAGAALAEAGTLAYGLDLLAFLMKVETRDRHLSVAPVGGRGRDDVGAAFDQQPIEVAALADACASAYRVTRDNRWLSGINLAWLWFLGDNDSKTPMFDHHTGGGYDGLEAEGRNLNQGAESTLAMLSTAQHAHRLGSMR